MKKLPLHVKIIIGLLLGVIYSFLSITFGWNEFTANFVAPFGTIFIRLLKFIAVPLVLFSIIGGVSSLSDVGKLGRMGAKTILAYLATTVTAITVGLFLVNMIAPGTFMAEERRIKNRLKYELWVQQTEGVEIFDGRHYLDEARHQHLLAAAGEALAEENRNRTVEEKLQAAKGFREAGPLQFVVDLVPENIVRSLSSGKLMLQVIFFAIFFGLMLLMIPAKKAEPVMAVADGINAVFMKMVEVVMSAAPFFVFALMSGVLARMADTPAEMLEILKGLAVYSVVVLSGLFLMTFVIYPSLVLLIVRKLSYREFFRRISPAQFLALSTSSSAATLPVTMECVRDNLGVSKNVSHFVLPIGATVNMDGTSLYQAVAVIFVAQLHMVELSLMQQLTVVLTATFASIGTAAVPSAGLVMLIVILQSVGLPPAWIAIIIPVDRILDMCRTAVNVTGDATVSTLIAYSEDELHVPEKMYENFLGSAKD